MKNYVKCGSNVNAREVTIYYEYAEKGQTHYLGHKSSLTQQQQSKMRSLKLGKRIFSFLPKGKINMAHNLLIQNGHASMFYINEVPWHGLGTKLDKPATAQEAIRAANLDWPVIKESICR